MAAGWLAVGLLLVGCGSKGSDSASTTTGAAPKVPGLEDVDPAKTTTTVERTTTTYVTTTTAPRATTTTQPTSDTVATTVVANTTSTTFPEDAPFVAGATLSCDRREFHGVSHQVLTNNYLCTLALPVVDQAMAAGDAPAPFELNGVNWNCSVELGLNPPELYCDGSDGQRIEVVP